jgi:hypothetical protein
MKETAPLWSMRGRINYNQIETIPGPGAYSPTSSMMYTSPQYRVGTARRRDLAEISLTPGPGAYSPGKSLETPS